MLLNDPSKLSIEEELATFSPTFGPEFLVDIHLKIKPNFVGNDQEKVELLSFTDNIEKMTVDYYDFENVLLLNVEDLKIDVQNDQKRNERNERNEQNKRNERN